MYLLLMLCITFGANVGCKKMIEVDLPVDKSTGEIVYGNANTSVTVLNGVYSSFSAFPMMGYDLGLVADEIDPIEGRNTLLVHYLNEYTDSFNSVFSTWENFYSKHIYAVNSLIEGVSSSASIGQENKKTLIAEAKFTRAFLYFYLVNLYGDVPLVLSTDFKVNSNIQRSPVDAVYQQIIKDLLEAKADLPARYLNVDLSTTSLDRVRPNRFGATALLARVYLYQRDWVNAELQSSELVDNSSDFGLENLTDVFLKNSKETIWAVQPNLSASPTANNNTPDGQWYIPYSGEIPRNLISDQILRDIEPNDNRLQEWIGKFVDVNVTPNRTYYYPLKYKMGANFFGNYQEQKEFLVVFRLAEQYLIRAEARVHLDKLTGDESAIQDLNTIRRRAGIADLGLTSKADILEAVYHERQIELYLEWGHRWLDLKRTGRVNEIMSRVTPIKGGVWSPYKALFPIPYQEFRNNPAMRGHQNPGYPEQPIN